MNRSKVIHISLSFLLMLLMAIGVLSCGENEEELAQPVSPVENPGTIVDPQEGSTLGPPAQIVWIRINELDGSRVELLGDFEDCDQIKHQNTFIVRVLDANGEPVPGARVEWTLNTWPDGVGDIIETDDPGHNDIPEVQAAPQIKVDNQFAITFTDSEDSSPPQLKGMGRDDGDILIREGETWITITSIREGDTDVTAFVPAIPRDGERSHKIFGVKHWVDLDWVFPNDQTNSINFCVGGVNEHTFVTTLTRVSNPNEFVPGVTVRYSILSGPNAIWITSNEPVSDGSGVAMATIRLIPSLETGELEPGEHEILVEILPVPLKRHGEVHDPGEVAGVCGIRKEVTKRWFGPSLEISKTGPSEEICLLTDASYSITVTNSGDAIATNITVTDTFDTGTFQFVSADNGGTNTDGVVTWNIGNLDSGAGKTVGMVLGAIGIGSSDNTAEVASAECVTAGPVVWTTVVVGPPELLITKTGARVGLPPETSLIVGLREVAVYEITVTNTSATCQATDVRITDTVDPVDRLPNDRAFEFVEGSASDGGTYADGIVTWPSMTLPSGGSITVSVRLQAIRLSEPGQPPWIPWINTAGVQCAEREHLLLPLVTVDFETTVVEEVCSVIFTLETDPDVTVINGAEVTGDYKLTNTGAKDATFKLQKITIDDDPKGLEITRITIDGAEIPLRFNAEGELIELIGEDEVLKPFSIVIPVGGEATSIGLSITLQGKIPRVTAYSVIPEGVYDCGFPGIPSLKGGTMTVLVTEQ